MKPSLVPGFSNKDLHFIIKFHDEFQGRQFAHLAQFLCPAVPGRELVKVRPDRKSPAVHLPWLLYINDYLVCVSCRIPNLTSVCLRSRQA